MFFDAEQYEQKMCELNLPTTVGNMFTNSKCTIVECIDCPDPCHDISVVLSNVNKNAKLSENASDKNIVKCFDTSAVTDMSHFLKTSSINADLSSWDVSSVKTIIYESKSHATTSLNMINSSPTNSGIDQRG